MRIEVKYNLKNPIFFDSLNDRPDKVEAVDFSFDVKVRPLKPPVISYFEIKDRSTSRLISLVDLDNSDSDMLSSISFQIGMAINNVYRGSGETID